MKFPHRRSVFERKMIEEICNQETRNVTNKDPSSRFDLSDHNVDEKTGTITDKDGRFVGMMHCDVDYTKPRTHAELLRGSSLSNEMTRQKAKTFNFGGDRMQTSRTTTQRITGDKGSPSRVEALVEEYRVKLSLKPWSEHQADAREICAKVQDQTGERVGFGRRSGRTTYGLLQAIARAQTRIFPADTIYIRARPQAMATHAYWMAKEMIAKLGLDMKVKILLNADRPPPQITLFTDHTY